MPWSEQGRLSPKTFRRTLLSREILPESGDGRVDLYRTLLELNATDLVHGAYGLEDGELIISDTLELETLDFHELQASMESIELAAASHMEKIRKLAGVEAVGSKAGAED